MILELNNHQLSQLQELIFDEIDRVGGYEQLSDELEDILQQILIIKNQSK
jgi:NTP pyrophosphatase (non-canonical NTP hydrolase)